MVPLIIKADFTKIEMETMTGFPLARSATEQRQALEFGLLTTALGGK